MRGVLLHAIASLCAVCALTGCINGKVPEMEGVLWFAVEDRDPDIKEPIMLDNGIMRGYYYIVSDEAAALLTEMSGIQVKKGNLLRKSLAIPYAITANDDGISGVITVSGERMQYHGLTCDSVIVVIDCVPTALYTPEKLGLQITGTADVEMWP